MNPFTFAFAGSGRVTRQTFAIAVIVVYLLGSASQILLTQLVLARCGVWPFALVHAVLLWVWFVLHTKRLRDAGRSTGSALGIAIVNVLSLLLLTMVVSLFATPDSGSESAGNILGTWVVIIFFLAVISGAPHLGLFAIILWAVLFIVSLPVVLAFGFSIWAGTRASVPQSPS